jgi:hypothetical protein
VIPNAFRRCMTLARMLTRWPTMTTLDRRTLMTVETQLAGLVALADRREDHVLAAFLCNAAEHVRTQLSQLDQKRGG